MLKILKEIHRVCEENGIQYFLSDGTLIGAVRHNGFIPWDDDLDIGMKRPDYEKFCAIAKNKLSDEFSFLTNKTDKGYGLCFGKVILKNTLWVENGTISSKNKCLYVDIFPYDKVADLTESKLNKYFKKIRLVDYFILCKFNIRDNSKKDKNYLIKQMFITCLPKIFLINYREKLMQKYKNIKSGNITKFGGNYQKNLIECNTFDSLILHKFEDSEFYIPSEYDKILTKLYGNYMELPPEDKRVTHNILDYSFDSAN